jgi:hypothetical protein
MSASQPIHMLVHHLIKAATTMIRGLKQCEVEDMACHCLITQKKGDLTITCDMGEKQLTYFWKFNFKTSQLSLLSLLDYFMNKPPYITAADKPIPDSSVNHFDDLIIKSYS